MLNCISILWISALQIDAVIGSPSSFLHAPVFIRKRKHKHRDEGMTHGLSPAYRLRKHAHLSMRFVLPGPHTHDMHDDGTSARH